MTTTIIEDRAVGSEQVDVVLWQAWVGDGQRGVGGILERERKSEVRRGQSGKSGIV